MGAAGLGERMGKGWLEAIILSPLWAVPSATNGVCNGGNRKARPPSWI